MEALFGDAPPLFVHRRTRSSNDATVGSVTTRTLLPWSVIHNQATGVVSSPVLCHFFILNRAILCADESACSVSQWIATLQTNQKALDRKDVKEASKSLRAFSMPTEHQAVGLARAWTPPRMLPFANHKFCHICKTKFAIFRRACHCRNCGVCVCKDCVVQWPAKMVPDTYNIKKEHFVHACKSCNWLCDSFRLALLEGDNNRAVALYTTGNVNVHTPFANVKGELFYPVHCAVLGGNLDLLKFLVDDNCCPIKSVRVAGSGSSNKYTPIVTSKGRSLLGIAMQNENLPIVRYLVVQKRIQLSGEKDVTPELLCRNFEKLLHFTPEESFIGSPAAHETVLAVDETESEESSAPVMGGDFDGVEPLTPGGQNDEQPERTLDEGARNFGAVKVHKEPSREFNETTYEECKFFR